MNWITKIIKASEKIKTAFHERASKEDIAKSDWTSCCRGPILKKDLEQNLWVCPDCNKHHRIKPSQRFDILFGKNNYEVFKTPIPKDDPLNWTDSKPYKSRLKDARKKTGLECSMVVAEGSINQIKITAIASDFDFMGASIGAAEGEAFLFAAQHAIENKQPLLVVSSGGGMKMQESLISLSQMTRTTLAINEVKAAGLPTKYYSSNRIASLMGNGLLTFIDKKTQMNDFFNNNEIIFYNSINDLSEKIKFYKKNEKSRVKIAKNGKKKYFKLFNELKTTKYIIDKSLGNKSTLY